jgi:hypothetical protein
VDIALLVREFGLPLGLLASVFVLMMTGRLIPRGTVDKLLKAESDRGNLWEKAYQTEHAIRMEQDKIMRESIEGMRTTTEIVRAIDRKTGGVS